MSRIRQLDLKIFNVLPNSYAINDGSVICGFDKMTDAERITRTGIYPIIGEPVLQPWQSKSDPVYTFTATEAQVSYTIADMPLADYKQQRIADVYNRCRSIIDQHSIGYSAAEIATFPFLQDEIKLYNANNLTIGVMMQRVIDRGRHTAASLSAAITPKIAIEETALQNRDDHVAAIEALATHQAVADYDITTGWPG